MTETKKEEPKEEKKPETITISKDVFDRMQKDIQMLKETSDRKRTAMWMHKNKDLTFPEVKLREINGKVILGWRSVKDVINYDTGKRQWVEDQLIEVLYEEGDREEMSLKDFENNYTLVPCEQIGAVEEGGNLALKLRRKDTANEYIIGVQFVN